MKNNMRTSSDINKVDIINEKIMSLIFRAELQRKMLEPCEQCDNLLETLSREIIEHV